MFLFPFGGIKFGVKCKPLLACTICSSVPYYRSQISNTLPLFTPILLACIINTNPKGKKKEKRKNKADEVERKRPFTANHKSEPKLSQKIQ